MSNLNKVDLSDFGSVIEFINQEFNGILRANLYEIGLNEEELAKLRTKKRELRRALKNCGIGDSFAKDYIKSSIKSILLEKLLIDEEGISKLIPFDNYLKLSVKDKFDILIFFYKKEYGNKAFIHMIEEYELLNPVVDVEGFKYEISEDNINDIYAENYRNLTFEEKISILTQRIYEMYRGLGVIDELRDMKIDGISGGVSGAEGNYKSVWAFIKGKNVHLSFLDFESEKELERICMNIYRYNHPGHLSMAKGYIVNEMKDHSRVVVARPPFSESFVFFVRKFDTIEHKGLEELITDDGAEYVIDVLRWIVKGCQVSAITGAQGSGKTTLLMALIRYIHPAYTLRIQEQAFELHLRDVYTDRNIVTFQETDFISGQEGLDLQKKTDGTVNILGEIATAPVASWMIQMAMVASLFTMFTHHAKTTDNLIKYLRNCLLTEGNFRDEMIAKEQVVDVLRFDVHMEKDVAGHRYIERITEIVPMSEGKEMYRLVNIIEFKNGKYQITDNFSENVREDMLKNMDNEERKRFCEFCNIQRGKETAYS